MKLRDADEAARTHHELTLATLRGNGLPQLSYVLHAVRDGELLLVPTTAGRRVVARLGSERAYGMLR